MIEIYANTTFNFSNTITLSNTLTWSAQTHVVNLDFNPIIDNTNTDIGWLSSNISPIANIVTSGVNNYTLSYSANTYQTAWFANNGVNPFDRFLIIQTQISGANSANTLQVMTVMEANNILLRVLNSQV
jgi:hypothetical protein